MTCSSCLLLPRTYSGSTPPSISNTVRVSGGQKVRIQQTNKGSHHNIATCTSWHALQRAEPTRGHTYCRYRYCVQGAKQPQLGTGRLKRDSGVITSPPNALQKRRPSTSPATSHDRRAICLGSYLHYGTYLASSIGAMQPQTSSPRAGRRRMGPAIEVRGILLVCISRSTVPYLVATRGGGCEEHSTIAPHFPPFSPNPTQSACPACAAMAREKWRHRRWMQQTRRTPTLPCLA